MMMVIKRAMVLILGMIIMVMIMMMMIKVTVILMIIMLTESESFKFLSLLIAKERSWDGEDDYHHDDASYENVHDDEDIHIGDDEEYFQMCGTILKILQMVSKRMMVLRNLRLY